jgi:hypothetical protein
MVAEQTGRRAKQFGRLSAAKRREKRREVA